MDEKSESYSVSNPCLPQSPSVEGVLNPSTTESEKLTDVKIQSDNGKTQLVIITKPVLEGENPLPLPNWFEVPKQPETREELETWKKDNIVRKYWTTKYPFLAEHYEEIKLSTVDKSVTLTSNVETYSKLSTLETDGSQPSNKEKYVGLESLESLFTPREKVNTDILDNNEDACLDKLFEQENNELPKVITEKTKPSDIDVNKANDHKSSPYLSPMEEEYLNSLSPELKASIQEKLEKEKQYNKLYSTGSKEKEGPVSGSSTKSGN